MKITAAIYEPLDTSVIIEKKFELAAIPLIQSVFIANENQYVPCCSLYPEKKDYLGSYRFEQILRKHIDGKPLSPPHYLLMGDIDFSNDDERDRLFQNITLKDFKKEMREFPYSYLRIFDCLQINDDIFRIGNITIKEMNIEIRLNKNPFSIQKFREHPTGYCPPELNTPR